MPRGKPLSQEEVTRIREVIIKSHKTHTARQIADALARGKKPIFVDYTLINRYTRYLIKEGLVIAREVKKGKPGKRYRPGVQERGTEITRQKYLLPKAGRPRIRRGKR